MKDANDILTAVIHHMRKDEPNTRVKQASITALINALEFTSKNFENQVERTAIMTCVCEATLSPDPEVKLTALQCLVRTMELYYEHMETYMQALFDISLAAIKTDPSDEVGEKVVLQGIEFWNTVCERELDIIDEIEQRGGDVLGAATAGIPVYKQYAKGAHLNLVPIVLNLLIQTIETEDEDDPDDWNPAKASALCLQLYANVCRDKILPVGGVAPQCFCCHTLVPRPSCPCHLDNFRCGFEGLALTLEIVRALWPPGLLSVDRDAIHRGQPEVARVAKQGCRGVGICFGAEF